MKRHGLTAALCLLIAAPVSADPVADFTSGGIATFTGELTWGFEFNVSSSLTVVALGFWDEAGDGLAQAHEVGLWDSGGTLLAQATVDNSSTPVPSSSSAGRWLFTTLPAPLTLTSGDYLIGAYYPITSPDAIRQGTGVNTLAITTIPGVTYLGPRISPSPSGALAIPTQDVVPLLVPNGVFGPSLREASAVPSMPPVGLVLLAGLLFVAVWMERRRRPATAR